RIAEVALAEIKTHVIPQHQEEALVGGLVKAKLFFQALDELGVKTLSAAIFGIRRFGAGAALHLTATAEIAAGGAGNTRGRAGISALELGNDTLNRPARRELHNNERNKHDTEQRRYHQQQAADDIGSHGISASASIRCRRPRPSPFLLGR